LIETTKDECTETRWWEDNIQKFEHASGNSQPHGANAGLGARVTADFVYSN
jgi:hypothetical protein